MREVDDSLIPLFGRKLKDGIIIDFQVTNDDIAGFCGISTRNSVNRILRGLREENVITMVNQKILILDEDYLKQFIQAQYITKRRYLVLRFKWFYDSVI